MGLAGGSHPTSRPSTLLRPVDPRHIAEVSRLRELFVGPELTRLDHIERTPPSPEVIARVLPEAMAHASRVRGDELATALGKPVARALRDMARRESKLLGEILAPTIGTAVRRAIAETIASVMQRMNQLLERSLSLRSIAWRFEAWRTGRPFAEVVLAHTLLYRVERVVLIHTETSLVLDQAVLPGAPEQAPDQMSAMLQAISTFVREAFQPATPGGDLDTLAVGDLTVWIVRNPVVTLAVALRGVPPATLRDTFRRMLERIQALHAEELAKRHPDPSELVQVHELLVESLHEELKPTRKLAQRLLPALSVAIALIVAAMLARPTTPVVRAGMNDLAYAYRAALTTAPGIVVISVERSGDRYRIEGLRDPRAEPAGELIAAAGLPPAQLALTPFDSPDPRFEGPLAAVDAAVRQLEAIEISFETNVAAVSPTQLEAIGRAGELANRAQRAAARAHLSLCVAVVGNADETGTEDINARLRVSRAAHVVAALRRAGADPAVLDPHPAEPTRAPPQRRVTFRAALRPDPQSRGCPP